MNVKRRGNTSGSYLLNERELATGLLSSGFKVAKVPKNQSASPSSVESAYGVRLGPINLFLLVRCNPYEVAPPSTMPAENEGVNTLLGAQQQTLI
jgi:hypothetical protein